jgi:glycosyltransferase A (GT-A) superfamily protein (DUF2064 family)
MYAAALADLNSWPGPTAVALAGGAGDAVAGVNIDSGNDAQQEHGRTHIRQPDGSFGKRLQYVDDTLRQTHAGAILFIGSDAPELTQAFYLEAARQLLTHDVVLAPAADGGVTLLGAKVPWPELAQLPWGSEQLCTALEQHCLSAGLTVARLPLSADVDTLEDILRLRFSLLNDRRPQQQQLLADVQAALPELGVVIPVKDDHIAAQALSLELQQQGADHILIIDQQRNAELLAHCTRHGIDYLQHAGNRGERLDVAARHLHDGNLWFLHADAQIMPGAANAVRQQLIAHDAGCFSFQFSAGSPTIAHWLAKIINWRARHFMAYGDQGIFIRRQAYLDHGGFAHEPLFEEVPLIKALKQQQRFRVLDMPIVVANRRWQKDGWVRRTLHNRWLVIRYILGSSPETLATSYTRR